MTEQTAPVAKTFKDLRADFLSVVAHTAANAEAFVSKGALAKSLNEIVQAFNASSYEEQQASGQDMIQIVYAAGQFELDKPKLTIKNPTPAVA